ncbi:MAG: HDOD domain-containing protein [Magnetococcales bacterium]|nr:HDOD domain-containing protein [Magnetococcales bacterium]NGZ26636.1 HDOD domain-containing protein [Magnetococcales bacterium]
MAPDLHKLIEAANSSLPSFPNVVRQVIQAVDNPFYSLDRIGQIITEDPALSARLLKIANSSFYRFPFPVSTISRALTIIGSKQLRDLITATTVIKMFTGESNERVKPELFWRHSIACGVWARVIATAHRESNVEQYYLTGLLHDVGHLVLLKIMPDELLDLTEAAHAGKRPLLDVERECWGFSHAEVGGELLRHWNLPAEIYQPILMHHTPSQSTDYHLETAILHVAELMSVAMLESSSLENTFFHVEPAAWERIALPVGAITALFELVDNQFDQALNLFSNMASS